MMPAVVILAGGVAKRLGPMTEHIPKSLLRVAGEPFIAHQFLLLKKNGIKEIIICSGYLSRQVEDFVGDGSKFGLNVVFSEDGEIPLGTGGAIKKALPLLDEEFFVMYGDSYLRVDFKDVQQSFLKAGQRGLMTVLKNNDAWGPSNIVFKKGRIAAYDKKNKLEGMDHIDYGLGLLKKDAFDVMGSDEIFDLSALYQKLIEQDQMAGYEVSERFYEIGSLAGLAETERYLINRKDQ